MKTPKIALLCCFAAFLAASTFAQTSTTLLSNGSAATKFDLVFMGDGFTSAQQAEYNTLVTNYFNAMFTHNNGSLDNVFSEMQDAFNVYRVNMNSVSSGVSQFTCSAAGCAANPPTARITPYNFQYSGCWECCWMSKSIDTDFRINNALAAVGLAGADYIVMILNEPGLGGCSYGRVLSITKTTSNNVLLHEMGHSVGGLADEYDRTGCFAALTPPNRNADINANNAKWNLFANVPTTTGSPAEFNVSQTTGEFVGAVYKNSCIHRPSSNCTMRGNTDLYSAPCYDECWVRNKPRSQYNFNTVYSGNFSGTASADVLLHFGDHIAAYETGTPDGFTGTGTANRVKSSYTTTKSVSGPGGTWNISTADKFYPADFNGDGKDDLLVFYPGGASSRFGMLLSVAGGFQCVRMFSGSLAGWTMRSGDRYYVADFDGDGRKDIYVSNTVDWGTAYMCMLRSTGTNMAFTQRYDVHLPGHAMSNTDKYFVADINADNRDELVLFNTTSKVTRVYQSSGVALTLSAEYFAGLPGWQSGSQDQYHVADFNGDNRDDLYIFNGRDWGPEYMLMLRSNGTGYDFVVRYDNTLPGWDMNNDDSYYVADLNGDGREDLIGYNSAVSASEYLTRIVSNGTSLTGSWQKDWVGGWNLAVTDRITVANATTGVDGLFVYNTDWFGYMIPLASSMHLQAVYKDYIKAFKHHDFGWY